MRGGPVVRGISEALDAVRDAMLDGGEWDLTCDGEGGLKGKQTDR